MSLRRILHPMGAALVVCVPLASCGTSSTVEGTPGSGPVCPGTCAPPQSGWKGPAVLWSGPKDKVPSSCPDWAPNVLYQGNADLSAPNECAACTCGPPAGSCGLPTEMTAYYSEIACIPNKYAFPFDPPPNWDGSCVKGNNYVPPNTFNTFIMGSLHLTESGCSPGAAIPEGTAPPPSWETYALACTGQGSPCQNGDLCLPTTMDPIPEGFGLCILHEGVEQCPDAYPHQHIFYDGVDDGRACAPCECGPPAGSECWGFVWVYEDTACMDPFLGTPVGLGPPDPLYCALSPDPYPAVVSASLGSMFAEPMTYTPGTCAAVGGAPIGAAVAKGPSTFCCRD